MEKNTLCIYALKVNVVPNVHFTKRILQRISFVSKFNKEVKPLDTNPLTG